MTWDRGSVADFDAWEELGNPGWNWESMISNMLKVENLEASAEYEGEGVGVGGPIQTLFNRIFPTHQENFIPTMNNLGIKYNPSSLGGNPLGVMRQPNNIWKQNYTRSYSPAYLTQARENLVLQLGKRVAKINFEGKTATGVTLEDGTVLVARKEVILSAGSIQSPGLLELSGIGNKDVLSAAGVTTIVYHLPGVGENLQDHLRIQNSYRLNPGFLGFDRLRYNATFVAEQLALYNAGNVSEYNYAGSGYSYLTWAQVSQETEASFLSLALESADSSVVDQKKLSFLVDPKLSSEVPQLELIFSDGYTGVRGYPAATSALYGAEFFTLIAVIQHPFARGSVHINSSSILVPPVIDPRYLSNPYDLAAVVAATKYVRKVASTAPLSSIWSAEYEPGADISTDAQWESFAKNTTLSIYHPVGTCAMLPEKDGGVVDPKLRVYGVKGLRIVDASIMPVLPSAHLQTAVYGIAEHAADIILKDWCL
jgi:choline dehydrogenase-like flavoprotein